MWTKEATGAALRPGSNKSSSLFNSPEPEPVFDLLCENSRPPLLHGSPFPGGHAHLDGCHSDGRWGLHTVSELRERWGWVWARHLRTERNRAEPLPAGSGEGLKVKRTEGMDIWGRSHLDPMRAQSWQRCFWNNVLKRPQCDLSIDLKSVIIYSTFQGKPQTLTLHKLTLFTA